MKVLLTYGLPAIAADIAVVLHEFTKAAVSSCLGDQMPANYGRLTLNPAKHLDALGLIVMYYTALMHGGVGLGWGKPVETSAGNYKDRRMGTILTYTMPSVVNILFGIILALVKYFFVPDSLIGTILLYLAKCNVSVGVFNIIPIYPMDGAKILDLYRKPTAYVNRNERILQFIFLFVVLMGYANLLLDPVVALIIGFAL